MFDDNFSYNHRPDDWEACCPHMREAVMVTGSVEILGNYTHVIQRTTSGLDVLDYCPWCRTWLSKETPESDAPYPGRIRYGHPRDD